MNDFAAASIGPVDVLDAVPADRAADRCNDARHKADRFERNESSDYLRQNADNLRNRVSVLFDEPGKGDKRIRDYMAYISKTFNIFQRPKVSVDFGKGFPDCRERAAECEPDLLGIYFEHIKIFARIGDEPPDCAVLQALVDGGSNA